jgi:hypothetical protein
MELDSLMECYPGDERCIIRIRGGIFRRWRAYNNEILAVGQQCLQMASILKTGAYANVSRNQCLHSRASTVAISLAVRQNVENNH